jgi:hypothetical protein
VTSSLWWANENLIEALVLCGEGKGFESAQNSDRIHELRAPDDYSVDISCFRPSDPLGPHCLARARERNGSSRTVAHN